MLNSPVTTTVINREAGIPLPEAIGLKNVETTTPTVLLCGYGELGLGTLKGLLQLEKQKKIILLGVFDWNERDCLKAERHQTDEAIAFQRFLRQQKIRQFTRFKGMQDIRFTQEVLERYQPSVILVSSWGEILKVPYIEAQKTSNCLLINTHPSLLPRHRGANPYIACILSNDTHTGVTFHCMSAELDAGDILHQEHVALAETDTGGSVRKKCAGIAEVGVQKLIQGLLSTQGITPQVQDVTQATSHTLKQISYPWLNVAAALPAYLVRQARALQPWCFGCLFFENQVAVLAEEITLEPNTVTAYTVPAGVLLLADVQAGLLISTTDPNTLLRCRKLRLFQHQKFDAPLPEAITKMLLPMQLPVGTKILPF
jgi:methionyl-tRNA formyltransferase